MNTIVVLPIILSDKKTVSSRKHSNQRKMKNPSSLKYVRWFLEQHGLLPAPSMAVPIPRDERFSLMPLDLPLFLTDHYDDGEKKNNLWRIINRELNIHVLPGNVVLEEEILSIARARASNRQLPVAFHWPITSGESVVESIQKAPFLPTHVFFCGTSASDATKRFLAEHDDLIVQHSFSPSTPSSEVARTMLFLLKEATLCKLDTRRATWISKDETPHYSSKVIRQQNNCPFDRSMPPVCFWPSKKLTEEYQRSKAHTSSLSNSNVQSVNKTFDLNRFEQRKDPPVVFDHIKDNQFFDSMCGFQCQDMLIKAPETDVRLPSEISNVVHEFVSKSMSHFAALTHLNGYYAYLTVTQGPVPPWQTQRRPGLHADGFFSSKHSPLINGQGTEANEIIYICCNALPPVFYLESFPDIASELDRERHDFWVAMATRTSQKPNSSCLHPYEIAMMDGYCLHSVMTNQTLDLIQRTFLRLVFSKQQYTLEGNTRNPHFPSSETWQWHPSPTEQAPPFFWSKMRELSMVPTSKDP